MESIITGNYIDNIKEGEFIYTFPNGNKYTGNSVNKKLNGDVMMIDSNGNEVIEFPVGSGNIWQRSNPNQSWMKK